MFIKTHALYKPDDCSEAEWEVLNPQQKADRSNTEDFVFNAHDIFAYNSNNTGGVTLRFRNGLTIMVVLTVEQMDGITAPITLK